MSTFEKVEKIARVCHQVNKAYCESQGDMSQKSWERSTAHQRSSCIRGVSFNINYPETSAAECHGYWMQMKIFSGWSYGKEKNEKLKTHPCLVLFDKLTKEQQAKDFIFKAIVESLRNT